MDQETKQAPTVTIKLSNTTPSAWVLEGSNRNGQEPIRMAFPGLYRIIPNSKVKEALPEGGYKLVPIRHIGACDSIIPSEQEAMGYGVDWKEDNIYMINGTLTVVREGSTIGTYDYIKKYQGNAHNPDRPPHAEIEFEEVRDEEIAAVENLDFDYVKTAIDILSSIRLKGKDGKIEWNIQKLNLICRLLDITVPSPDEKFSILSRIAVQDPETLVNTVVNDDKLMIAEIKAAETNQVLFFTEDMVHLADNTVVLHFRNGPKKKDAQMEKLIEFFKTEEGSYLYKQMLIAAGDKQTKQLSSNPI